MSAQYMLKKGVSFVKLSNLPVNGLALGVREGLMRALDQARVDKSSGLVVFGDGKNFCAGADIAEFSTGKFKHEPDLNMVLESMDAFENPLIAAIDGVALGGGLELALTCHWRIASPKAMVGLPEVHLGLLPGAGGTQRLPRLIGVEKALDAMISGRNIKAEEALELGIIDSVVKSPFVSHEDVVDNALDFVLSERVQNTPVSERRVSSLTVPGVTSENKLTFLDNQTRDLVKKSGYVAPLSIFEAVKASATLPTFKEGRAREQELFEGLASGPQAPALQYAFFAERVASSPPKVGKGEVIPNIKTAGVIGGGTMGSGITMVLANAGLPVTLVETSLELAEASREKIQNAYMKSSAFKSGKLSQKKLEEVMALISFTSNMQDLADADFVVEAVFEDMATKKDIFSQLDKICKQEAILATNTSFMDIDEIAGITSRPENVVGTHFFAPANAMKLLEIVKGEKSSAVILSSCASLGKRIGKLPIIAGNCFGFIGNRMIDVYGKEAYYLVEEGATPAQVDAVMKDKIGMAMGIFEMSDLSGNDVTWRLRQSFGLTGNKMTTNAGVRYCDLPDKLCEKGWFGQKSKHGWYKYDPSSPRKPIESSDTMALIDDHRRDEGIVARTISDEEILQRCLYSLFNEGLKILEEGISKGPEDIDMVFVYGYGFPRYKGGPMYWAEKEQGLENILLALESLYSIHPTQPWLKPAILLQRAVENKTSIKTELKKIREL